MLGLAELRRVICSNAVLNPGTEFIPIGTMRLAAIVASGNISIAGGQYIFCRSHRRLFWRTIKSHAQPYNGIIRREDRSLTVTPGYYRQVHDYFVCDVVHNFLRGQNRRRAGSRRLGRGPEVERARRVLLACDAARIRRGVSSRRDGASLVREKRTLPQIPRPRLCRSGDVEAWHQRVYGYDVQVQTVGNGGFMLKQYSRVWGVIRLLQRARGRGQKRQRPLETFVSRRHSSSA